jgi:phosphoenolpyruvate synthase/pyruvate phosphate dikinase
MSAVETSAICEYVVPLSRLTIGDVAAVGGKNASLGEMIGALAQAGVRVPGGFATTADAYREFLRQDRLDARIAKALAALDVEDIAALTATGKQIRDWILSTRFPPALEAAVIAALERMDRERADRRSPLAVAVRSSATAEDLPDASFAGQQETFSMSAAAPTCCAPCTRSSPLCSTTGRSLIACTTGSLTMPSHSRSACSRWFAATSVQAA